MHEPEYKPNKELTQPLFFERLIGCKKVWREHFVRLDTTKSGFHTRGLNVRQVLSVLSYRLAGLRGWVIRSPACSSPSSPFANVELTMWRRIFSFFNKTDMEAGMAGEFFIGESLVGDGNEIAHIDLIIGSKSGPTGLAFTQALSHNSDGFSTLLAVVTPNLPAKPDTLLFNKVTIKGAKQAVQMFGPAQAAVARAVMDSVASGVIDKSRANDLCILVGVFIHWQAENDKKIYDYNYQATKESIQRALQGKPTIDEVLQRYKAARHPFASGAEG